MNRTDSRRFRGLVTAIAVALAPTAALSATGTPYQAPSVEAQQQAVADSVQQLGNHKTASPFLYRIMADRLERDFTDKGDFSYFEGQAWFGSSTDKLWLKGEATRVGANTEDANLEAYYSHAIAGYWDVQLGARHDFASGGMPSRDWAAVGLQGLSPYKFETSLTAYVGDDSRTAARLTGEYDFYVTQRLVFWPEAEFNLYGKDDPERGIGSGLSDGRIALRFRYEIRRELAPYVGVQWTRKFAQTADYASRDGEAVHDRQLIAGLRFWW